VSAIADNLEAIVNTPLTTQVRTRLSKMTHANGERRLLLPQVKTQRLKRANPGLQADGLNHRSEGHPPLEPAPHDLWRWKAHPKEKQKKSFRDFRGEPLS
jgi:hypothetical protein